MYQDNTQRKWISPPAANPPLDNLKTFLQKRIRAIMAKEWWDFIVNVNTLNSDHASLLYSLANLCPSFNYFLQSKDRELQLIIKKRPVVKPRIFSGSERMDTTPDPIVPKQLPLVTRRNSANELLKILNELYPNENTLKNKQPRTYGPASRQKKNQLGHNKKNLALNTEELLKKNNSTKANNGYSPLLRSLLADESQKENAHNVKINVAPTHPSMPVLVENNDEFNKAVLSNKNYDLNQNRLNHNPRKIKKIIKVKKKRYVYSNALTDPKNRLKYILEDETPNLSLKLIKKYRIKKCSVSISRLKDSVLKYYTELRYKNENTSQENFVTLVSSDVKQLSDSQISVQDSQSNNNPQPTAGLISEKGCENIEKNVLEKCHKENVTVLDKLDPKELKNMYCHGGIVPLGKVITSDKFDFKNKHLVHLKEKKVTDDAVDNNSKLKEIKVRIDENVEEANNVESRQLISKEVSLATESDSNETLPNMLLESGYQNILNNKPDLHIELVSDSKEKSSICDGSSVILEKHDSISTQLEECRNSEVNADLIKSNCDSITAICDTVLTKNTDSEESSENTDDLRGKVEMVSETCTNEVSVSNNEKLTDNQEAAEPFVDTRGENLESGDIESLAVTLSRPSSEEINNSSKENYEKNTVLKENQPEALKTLDSLLNTEVEQEPLAKRPRIEINLTEMKLEITKTIVDSGNNDDHICKMCKVAFDSVENWNSHFENNIPKCTPNLKISWDSTEISL